MIPPKENPAFEDLNGDYGDPIRGDTEYGDGTPWPRTPSISRVSHARDPPTDQPVHHMQTPPDSQQNKRRRTGTVDTGKSAELSDVRQTIETDEPAAKKKPGNS